MRVALVHDYLNQYGGAERVLEAFCEIWPRAPIFTLVYNKEKTGRAFEKKKIRTSFILIVFAAIVFSAPKFFQHEQVALQDYYVSRVVDGDTIELSNGEKVRYIGIDTPEIRERKGSKWI